ncbi:immunity 49 family protein [Streptomyces sp. NPDC001941]|uniref:immunity 49 family protein n=1 Tax=Streptomyces sp. NPDC001941 TaxID=3154659 RepID=UPI003329CBC5
MIGNNTPEPPDPDLPALTAPQATRLRALAAPHFRDGHHYGLHHLAQRCARTPEDEWPALVAGHFDRLRQASPGGEDARALLDGAHPRLLPTDALTPDLAGQLRYTRPVADGLVLAHALDGPTSVRILTDADVARAGAPELDAAARENLMRVPVRHEEVDVAGRARMVTVFGDSPFVAGQALYLARAAHQVTGEDLPDGGALVVVPNRHLYAYHPVADGSVVDALNGLAAYGLRAYQEGPGSLSPRVYWWYRGQLTSLTAIDEETRSFTLRPPPRLLALMKSLIGLDRAGRIATAASAPAPDPAVLTRRAADAAGRLAEDPAALADAFSAAVALAHARCADDPAASRAETWEPWALAVQLGTALFGGTPPLTAYADDRPVALPALDAQVPADARAWLDALYLAVVCRQHERVRRLCEVPLEALRRDDSVDAYVLHWIETLRVRFAPDRTVDDVVPHLVAVMEGSAPDALTHGPGDFVNQVDHHPAALFHRLLTGDHEAFATALSEALDDHRAYWGTSGSPRARVPLGVLAMTCLAHDAGFPLADELPFLPKYLVDGRRIEHIA